MSPYTAGSVGIVVLLAAAAYVGEWCGILAFAIALLMVFELDLHSAAERGDDDKPNGEML